MDHVTFIGNYYELGSAFLLVDSFFNISNCTFISEKGNNPAIFDIINCNNPDNLITDIVVKNTIETNFLIKSIIFLEFN